MKQILFSMIEGNGRQKVHILKSPGGDGKSTFIRIGSILGGGNNYFVRANLDEFADDNTINLVSLATSGVLGDDLSTNAKFGGKNLGRVKTMVSGEPFQVSMKYHDNVIVQTNAVFIQATNTELSFYENSPAIQDRLIVNNWISKNFRRHPIKDFNLDKLTGASGNEPDWNFIEAMNALIMQDVSYFEQYTIPKRSQGLNEEMVQNSDQVFLMVQMLYEQGLLDFRCIPLNVLYNYFGVWLKQNNAGSSPLSYRKFSGRIQQVMPQFGFHLAYDKEKNRAAQSRLSSIESNNLDFNISVFEELIGSNLYVNKKIKTLYFINNNNKISNNNIETLRQQFITNNEIPNDFDNVQDHMILNYLINVKRDVEILTLMNL